MSNPTKTRFPAPLYAAAGAGDLAYQQLRKLPAVVSELSERAAESLRSANEQAGSKAASLRDKATTTDFDALRTNAASVANTFAQVAQERAFAVYTALVARGERVVGTGVVEVADVVNADMETTDEPHAVEGTPVNGLKPRKRITRPDAE